VDYDFAETFKLKVIAGREFDKSYGTDHLGGYVINEMAVRTLGWENPEAAIGQNLSRGGAPPGKVIGVVNNFHTAGLQNAMTPIIMNVSPGAFTAFAIRLKSDQTQAITADIEKAWRQFFPGKAFEYDFITDSLQDGYEQEARLMQLIGHFSGLFWLIWPGRFYRTAAQKRDWHSQGFGRYGGRNYRFIGQRFSKTGGHFLRIGLSGGLLVYAKMVGRLCLSH
jgi:putative ABC transport system permease protein